MTVPNDILLSEVGRLLGEGHEVILLTKGGSMLPFIRGEKDSVLLKKRSAVEVGDIVLAEIGEGKYVLHRILSRDGEKLTLMGDGNLKGTESCLTADVLGTVLKIVTPGGRMKSPSKGRVWKWLRPVRRYLLAIIRRIR